VIADRERGRGNMTSRASLHGHWRTNTAKHPVASTLPSLVSTLGTVSEFHGFYWCLLFLSQQPASGVVLTFFPTLAAACHDAVTKEVPPLALQCSRKSKDMTSRQPSCPPYILICTSSGLHVKNAVARCLALCLAPLPQPSGPTTLHNYGRLLRRRVRFARA
jgi:hypothetical protein